MDIKLKFRHDLKEKNGMENWKQVLLKPSEILSAWGNMKYNSGLNKRKNIYKLYCCWTEGEDNNNIYNNAVVVTFYN